MTDLHISVTEEAGSFVVVAVETRRFASVTAAEDWAHVQLESHQEHLGGIGGGQISYDVSDISLAEMDRRVAPDGGA